VNCAAFTAVDKAESNKEFCAKLNVEAVEILARSASKHGAKMIQISTDYVFDGCGHKPYTENDEPNPQSVYGATKLDGEKALLKIAPDCVIVRTAWLYSPYGKNFVKTMLNLGRTKDALKVVVDQIGTPTYAGDLSKAIMAIIKNPEWKAGIYHFSDEGVISWYDFTKAIHRIAGITSCDVQPCNTTDYPTPATRPHYSVLDKTKIKATFGIKIPYWEDSLAECIKRLEDK
jgi:dTDP-4-dehydrorhamnose reductase